MVKGASGHIANLMALQQHPIYSKFAGVVPATRLSSQTWGDCNPLLSSRGGQGDTHKNS